MDYRRIATITLSLLTLITLAHGQKFGYLNTAELIELHPRIDSANKALELYRIEITGAYETKVKSFQAKYQFYIEEMQAGTLSKVSAESRQAELAKQQEELRTEEQQLQFAMMQKREQLLQPILNEVDAAIQAIGKEGQYTMIFDTSVSGGLVYAVESDDLMPAAKSKLGIR